MNHVLELEGFIARLPIVRHLGLAIRVEDSGAECRLARVGPEHLGGLEMEVLNGGIVLAMMDAVTVVSGMVRFPEYRCATLDLNVSFVRGASPHGARAVGAVTRATARLAFVRAELVDANGNPCAQGQGIVQRLGRRRNGFASCDTGAEP